MTSFVDCRLPSSTCATLPFASEYVLGGVNGLCDNNTGLCECPPGNTGNNLIGQSNDCHVSVQVMLGLEASMAALLMLATLVCLGTIVRVLARWKILFFASTNSSVGSPTPRGSFMSGGSMSELDLDNRSSKHISRRPSQAGLAPPEEPLDNPDPFDGPTDLFPGGRPSLVESDAPRRPSLSEKHNSKRLVLSLATLSTPDGSFNAKEKKSKAIEIKRKRFSLLCLLCVFLYCVSGLVYACTRLFLGVVFEQGQWFQLVFFALAVFFNTASIWALIYTWYCGVPSLLLFSNMFPSARGSFLVKYPRFVKFIALINVIACFIGATVLWCIVPLLRHDLVPLVMVEIGFLAFAASIFSIALTLFLVSTLLLKFFAESKRVFLNSVVGPKTGGSNKGASLEEMSWIVGVVRVLAVVFGGLICTLVVFMALDEFTQRQFFLFMALLIDMGSIIVLVTSGIFWLRTKNAAGTVLGSIRDSRADSRTSRR